MNNSFDNYSHCAADAAYDAQARLKRLEALAERLIKAIEALQAAVEAAPHHGFCGVDGNGQFRDPGKLCYCWKSLAKVKYP